MSQTKGPEGKNYDLDSVASILWNADLGYLLQHREDIPNISYPGWWSLFGGACEEGESVTQALQRELHEELELHIPAPVLFFTCIYDLEFQSRYVRKSYFVSNVSHDMSNQIVLHEGQGLEWIMPDMLIHRVPKIVPYDVTALMLHINS